LLVRATPKIHGSAIRLGLLARGRAGGLGLSVGRTQLTLCESSFRAKNLAAHALGANTKRKRLPRLDLMLNLLRPSMHPHPLPAGGNV